MYLFVRIKPKIYCKLSLLKQSWNSTEITTSQSHDELLNETCFLDQQLNDSMKSSKIYPCNLSDVGMNLLKLFKYWTLLGKDPIWIWIRPDQDKMYNMQTLKRISRVTMHPLFCAGVGVLPGKSIQMFPTWSQRLTSDFSTFTALFVFTVV